MDRKRSAVFVGLGLFLAVLLFAVQPGFAASLAALAILGNGPDGGSTNISCTHATDPLCPTSHTCWCNSSHGSATTKLAGLAKATFAADTVIDLSSVVGTCDNTSGHVAITSGSGTNSLVLDYSGLGCTAGSDFGINVSYIVDSSASTGKFAGATGTGLISGSEDPSNGDILGNVSGNIIP